MKIEEDKYIVLKGSTAVIDDRDTTYDDCEYAAASAGGGSENGRR